MKYHKKILGEAGIKPLTFCSSDLHSANWATMAKLTKLEELFSNVAADLGPVFLLLDERPFLLKFSILDSWPFRFDQSMSFLLLLKQLNKLNEVYFLKERLASKSLEYLLEVRC